MGATEDLQQHIRKSVLDLHNKTTQSAVAALAGWTISDTFVSAAGGSPRGQHTKLQIAAHQRAISDARKRGKKRNLRKAIEDFYKDAGAIIIKAHAPIPPIQGEVWDPVKHRWTSPEKTGKTIQETQGGKRFRGTGVGVHERAVGGHGTGGTQRFQRAGRRFRGGADVSVREPEKVARRKKVDASKDKKQTKKGKKGKK